MRGIIKPKLMDIGVWETLWRLEEESHEQFAFELDTGWGTVLRALQGQLFPHENRHEGYILDRKDNLVSCMVEQRPYPT